MADKTIYSDNPEKSFEFLHLAIDLLEKLKIPADPHNYQLAYEYVSGSNQALIDDAHLRGMQVYVYTVNDHEDIQIMKDMGVDGIFSDYPDRV